MSGPLSGSERRSEWTTAADQERKSLETAQKMRQKEEEHELKLRGMAAKYGVEPPKQRPFEPKIGSRTPLPTPTAAAPLAAPASAQPGPQPTDTQPAMLTPGEAVIPAASAQNPKNQGIIARLVQEGRDANTALQGLMQHFTGNPGAAPIGTGSAGQARDLISGRGQQIDAAVQKAAGYADGTTAVPFPLARR